MADCATFDFVEDEVNRLATQYREATKFIGMVRAYLAEVQSAARAVCDIADRFDIDTAIGDQLTLIGKRMGFGRRHCVCVTLPVLGFPYPDGTAPPLAPPIQSFFCGTATWIECGATGQGEVSLDDDALYRAFLKARRYQMLGLYDIASLRAAAAEMWGASVVIHSAPGQAIIAPGRVLSATETALLPLALRVMPIAPGIRPMVHFGTTPIIGFGTGWASFCDGGFLCPVFVDPYGCAA